MVSEKSLDLEIEKVEVDKRLYFKHMRELRYKKKEIKQRWQRLTSEEKIAAGKCVKKGKKKYVWVKMPRKLVLKDGVHCELTDGAQTQTQVSAAQATQTLNGQGEMLIGVSDEAFGGTSSKCFCSFV